MPSPLDWRSLLRLSNTVCHHPVAQMSKTVGLTQGLQCGDEKSLLGGLFAYVTDNYHTTDAIKYKDNFSPFKFAVT